MHPFFFPSKTFRLPALLLACFLSSGCGSHQAFTYGTSVSSLPLAQARAGHETKLLRHGPSPQPVSPEERQKPTDVQEVQFVSHGRTLFGWLGVPNTPGPHPGLLYAHGGFALGSSDFDDVRPFVQAGYVVFAPAWRGEDGNPGDFQMLYGEVNDAGAALDYLAKVPGVDPRRLFAAGHSIGGTTVMLLAESTTKLRGAAACGGFPDMCGTIHETGRPTFAQTPFDWRDKMESDLRSPARHLSDLHCPLDLFYGEQEEYYIRQANAMQADAQKKHQPVTVTVIPGTDHFAALAPAIQKMIARFNAE